MVFSSYLACFSFTFFHSFFFIIINVILIFYLRQWKCEFEIYLFSLLIICLFRTSPPFCVHIIRFWIWYDSQQNTFSSLFHLSCLVVGTVVIIIVIIIVVALENNSVSVLWEWRQKYFKIEERKIWRDRVKKRCAFVPFDLK